jgi:hypothetical protein
MRPESARSRRRYSRPDQRVRSTRTDALVGIAMRFQIAQKLHVVSDLHETGTRSTTVPTISSTCSCCATSPSQPGAQRRPSFGRRASPCSVRDAEAAELGRPTRAWPPRVVAQGHSRDDFARVVTSGAIESSLDGAVVDVNAWISEIDRA